MKKKKTIKKSKTSKTKDTREKTFGEPQKVIPVSKNDDIYPKLFFRKDSLWDKIKRFFGFGR